MQHALELIFEYREILDEIRLDTELGGATGEQHARRIALEQLVGHAVPWRSDRTGVTPLDAVVPITYTMPGEFGSGVVHRMTGGGFLVMTPTAPEPGTLTIMRATDDAGAEYVFPGRVAWRSRGKAGAMGVVLDGVPTRAETTDGLVSWRSRLRFSRGPRETMTA